MGSLSIEGVNLSGRSIPDSPPIMGFSGTALPGAELYPEQLSMAAARIVRVFGLDIVAILVIEQELAVGNISL